MDGSALTMQKRYKWIWGIEFVCGAIDGAADFFDALKNILPSIL